MQQKVLTVGAPSQCHFGLLFCEGMGLIQPLAFLSTARGLSYLCLAAPMACCLLLSGRLCFPASLAISTGALEGMNITDKAFRLHKSPRGTSGAKILRESRLGE